MTTRELSPTAHGSKPGERIQQAQALGRAGQSVESEEAWRAILTDFPDSQAAAMGLVKSLDARGARTEAEAVLTRFVTKAPMPGNILAAARVWEQWQDSPRAGSQTLRLALTGTGTLGPLSAHLRVGIAQMGLHPALFVSDFGQWAQDLLAPHSALYGFAPQLIVLLLDAPTLFPKTMSDITVTMAEIEAERAAGIRQITDVIAAARRHAPAATVLLHTFALPDHSPMGALDLSAPNGQRHSLEEINRALVALAQEHTTQMMLFDQERIEARHGKAQVRDDRMWYMASLPFSDSFLPIMAAEYVRLIRPLTGRIRKCVVLDLDNTLWGGVIGEDGINQIKLGGSSAPGNAFHDFQSALKALQQRGVLLALCSKNNPDDVGPVLDGHPSMVLRRPDFAAMRINWEDKAANIAEIARELNIGLDSLVFLDDSPVERGLVRQRLPDVLTVEMPRDPAFYTRTLQGLDVFETLTLTDEDRRRGALYREQQEREQFRESTAPGGDLSAYLTGLQIVAEIAPAIPFTLPRIAQLINKTNQFNLTTRRYTEAQVQAMADAPSRWGVYSLSVGDRFGDSGLTGVAIIEKGATAWRVDSFLLSCRVLGRGVEQALLRYILDRAQAADVGALVGEFLPTAKNAPAADFYARMGFTQTTPGGPEWRLTSAEARDAVSYPAWLTVHVKEEE